MTDPLIARFAEACGATGPLDLRVESADGGVRAEGSVPLPFCLVGRDEVCDAILTDPDVNPRHAWVQVLCGAAYAVDLGSRTGIAWPDGATGSGWFAPAAPARIGPFRLHLRTPPAGPPPTLNPLQADPAVLRSRPAVTLEFRNGKRAKDRWRVNRLLTLAGRSPECKLHLSAEDVAQFHCGLVLTPAGLWVVDLSGRGVVVNGERMRVSPLPDGAELWVGRFLIGCRYPADGSNPPPSGRLTPTAQPDTTRLVPPPVDDEEVPVGVHPPRDPALGLPSSHIMADAFPVTGGRAAAGAPVSGSLLVSGGEADEPDAVTRTAEPGGEPDSLAILLRRLAEVQAGVFGHLDDALRVLGRLAGGLPAGLRSAVEPDLSRLGEVNTELGRLTAQLAGLAATRAEPPSQADIGTVIDARPLPDLAAVGPGEEVVEDWVFERVAALQREAHARWARLAGAVRQMTNAPPMTHQ